MKPNHFFIITCLLAMLPCCTADSASIERPKLQILNGSRQPIDIFWLKSDAERVSNGSVAPGKDTIITTTLGHRFEVVGRDDKTTAFAAAFVRIVATTLGRLGTRDMTPPAWLCWRFWGPDTRISMEVTNNPLMPA